MVSTGISTCYYDAAESNSHQVSSRDIYHTQERRQCQLNLVKNEGEEVFRVKTRLESPPPLNWFAKLTPGDCGRDELCSSYTGLCVSHSTRFLPGLAPRGGTGYKVNPTQWRGPKVLDPLHVWSEAPTHVCYALRDPKRHARFVCSRATDRATFTRFQLC